MEYAMTNYRNAWSPETTARLAELWEKGLSASLIGAELGVTRNSVLGRAFRLGLGKRREAYPQARRRVPTWRKKPDPTSRPSRVLVVKSNVEFFDPTLTSNFCANPVDILGITADQCRWVIGEPRELKFCGEAKFANHSFCARHSRIAYRPARERKAA
jgi:GcrA cell cycle regulator